MTSRGLLLVLVALGSMPGCGMGVRKLDAEALAAATTAVRSFPESPHRVALAAFETLRAELASAEFAKNSEFSPRPGLHPSRGKGSCPRTSRPSGSNGRMTASPSAPGLPSRPLNSRGRPKMAGRSRSESSTSPARPC